MSKSKSETKHFYRQKVEIADLEVEYNSEDDEITIGYTHRFGKSIWGHYSAIRIPPMYVDTLCGFLREVAPQQKPKRNE